MCWYRSRSGNLAVIICNVLLASFISACKPDIKETGDTLQYFDLTGYFKADSARLTRLNPLVLKTVKHNGVAESKKIHINNWGRELSLFSESDINKPAWQDSYTIQNTNNAIIYTANDPELKTREITINKDHGKIKWILILNHTKNILYETSEKLTYFPDSIYRMQKIQQVRLLGKNTYDIKGVLN
jgi:hypothetical protein